METKYKQIEFDIELAKKIQASKAPGEIMTREGLEAEIICFDYHGEDGESIVAINRWRKDGMPMESVVEYFANGTFRREGYGLSEKDLILIVPDDKPKYEFKPFDKVLWRNYDNEAWSCGWFSHYTGSQHCPHALTHGNAKYCIPYNEETEHLLGTTKNWNE